MIKKAVLYSLVFIIALALMVFINTPARWVYNQFVKPYVVNLPIVIAQPKGRILRGYTQIASIPERMPIPLFVENLRWYPQFQGLLEGKLMLQIDAEDVQMAGKALGDYSAFIGIDFSGPFIKLADNNALLKLNAKIDLISTPRIANGTLQLRRDDPQIKNLLATLPMIKKDGSFVINF